MTKKPIYLSTEDYPKLRALVSAVPAAKTLRDEIDRAVVLDPLILPRGVVRVGSEVTMRDLDTAEVEVYTVCMPENANPAEGLLSVLAPIGTALVGYSEGDTIEWETPGGVRRLEIQRVTTPELVEKARA